MRISDWSSDVCSSDLPKVMRVQMPAEGSAAAKAQTLLGENVTVVSGFHSVAAHKLATDEDIGCDVLVFGDDKDARAIVVKLADQAGLRGIHGGALVNSAAAEALTSVLIFINKRSEEHTSELQSLMRISYAVFCLKKKKKTKH